MIKERVCVWVVCVGRCLFIDLVFCAIEMGVGVVCLFGMVCFVFLFRSYFSYFYTFFVRLDCLSWFCFGIVYYLGWDLIFLGRVFFLWFDVFFLEIGVVNCMMLELIGFIVVFELFFFGKGLFFLGEENCMFKEVEM